MEGQFVKGTTLHVLCYLDTASRPRYMQIKKELILLILEGFKKLGNR